MILLTAATGACSVKIMMMKSENFFEKANSGESIMEEPLNSEKPINTPDITDVNLTKFIVSTMDFNYLLQVEAALLPEHLLLPELHPLLLLFDDPRQFTFNCTSNYP